jgi:hypothetical protein
MDGDGSERQKRHRERRRFWRSSARTLAVTSETDDAPKTVRRAVADGSPAGGTLLVTQFQDAKPTPTRQFSRYPLDELTPLTRSLQLARFAPATKAGDLLLTPDWRLANAALVYVSRPDSSSGSTAVVQTDLPAGRDRDQTKVTHRYLIDNKTGRLRRYEEWRTSKAPARPAARNRPADSGLRLTYRREEYTESAAPLAAGAFSQALPAGYTEQTAAAATLPPLPRQPTGDPKALALLRKWETAGERYLTLNAVADVRTSVEQRAENGRPNRGGRGRQGMDMLCTIWRQRPGQARIVVNALDPKTQQPKVKADYVAVADGKNVRINDYLDNDSNTDAQRDPAVVPLNRMRQVVRQAWDSGIGWVFDGPPAADAFTEIALDTTAAAPTLVFSRVDSNTNGRGQKMESRVLWRVTLGPDNLPRQIVSRRDTNIVGAYERDQPPSFTTTIRLQRIALDAEPLPDTFILPQEIARR